MYKTLIKATGTIGLLLTILTIQGCLVVDDESINAVCSGDCITILGKFTTEDGRPIKNVSLELDWSLGPTPGMGWGGKIRKIMTGGTNENGDYKFVFFAKDEELIEGSYSVKFAVPDDSYITLEHDEYFQFYGINKRDTTVVANYHVPRKGAGITLKIKNPESITGDDQLISSVYYKYGLNKSVRFVPGQLFSMYGAELTIGTAANQWTYIKTSKKINGQYFNSQDSVTISLNETITYEVEF